MLFTIRELFDILMMIIGVGFIFMDSFGVRQKIGKLKPYEEDPVSYYQHLYRRKISKMSGFNWGNLWTACLITAPAIVFHELAHKFVAINYGLQAVFHAAYFWLSVGILMKILNTGFIFFVPGYVTLSGYAMPLQKAAIAFAGPFVNLILWFCCWSILKFMPFKINTKTMQILAATRFINGFLFIFNMIPLGFFDGAKVLSGVIEYFAGV